MSLPEPRSAAGAHGLASLLRDPGSALLVFDFDGVLSPIVSDPAQAYAHPAVVAALRRITPYVAGAAVLTGRPARVAVSLGGLDSVPELAAMRVVGQYGLEHMASPGGPVQGPAPDPALEVVRRELPVLLESAPAGVHLEDKGHGLVVHTRPAADPEAALSDLEPALRKLADEHGLVAEPGRMVLEIRPRGVDKGAALRSLVAEFGARTVLYAGDDLGDIPAFDAVDSLRETSDVAGILVAVASEEQDALVARADLVVDDPEGVAAMLEALVDRLES